MRHHALSIHLARLVFGVLAYMQAHMYSCIFAYCELAVCFEGILLRLNICMTVFLVVSS